MRRALAASRTCDLASVESMVSARGAGRASQVGGSSCPAWLGAARPSSGCPRAARARWSASAVRSLGSSAASAVPPDVAAVAGAAPGRCRRRPPRRPPQRAGGCAGRRAGARRARRRERSAARRPRPALRPRARSRRAATSAGTGLGVPGGGEEGAHGVVLVGGQFGRRDRSRGSPPRSSADVGSGGRAVGARGGPVVGTAARGAGSRARVSPARGAAHRAAAPAGRGHGSSALHGALGAVEHLRGLGDGVALHVDQHQRGALVGGEGPEGVEHRAAALVGDRQLGRVGLGVGGGGERRRGRRTPRGRRAAARRGGPWSPAAGRGRR